MKQIIQNLKTGETSLENVPAPQAQPGKVVIRTSRSLVSLGTERMLVEFGKANLIQKAKQQPDKVKMVLDKVKAEGLLPTLETVFTKLNQPIPLGYCNVGRVVSVGKGVTDFAVGDRVASNGNHAEFVSCPQNLVAHIPDSVSDNEATFTVIGSIGLQGIRLLNPTLGETVVVIGLGLIGLITAELLIANGCNVIGVELDEQKILIAKEKGVIAINPKTGIDPVKFVLDRSGGMGADGVLITASAKTDEIISQAARMSRKRGKVVLVGVVGLNISRAEFYEKELTFQVSCSYGPGRYDDNYEEKGIDYPFSFVRWTEKRNFETILEAIGKSRIKVNDLITDIIPLDEYEKIYGQMGKSNSIASLLAYDEDSIYSPTVKIKTISFNKSKGVFGVIGAGNYTKMALLPAMSNAQIKYIAGARGVNSTALGKKHGIVNSTSDYHEILSDDEVDHIVITTRHNLHAEMVLKSLQAGKNVFVEKPLVLNVEDLNAIIRAQEKSGKVVTVGFNRRFSPHIQKIKSLINADAPKNLIATMNAGFIPANVWIHDLEVGGGRIIGEACHYIDLLVYISGSLVKSVCMNALGTHPVENTDNASILLKFENGDTGVVNYFANGNKAYSKERLEVFSQEKTIIMDNFRLTTGYGTRGFSKLKTKIDKGHKTQFKELIQKAENGGEPLIPFEEIVNVTKASFAAIESLKKGSWVDIS